MHSQIGKTKVYKSEQESYSLLFVFFSFPCHSFCPYDFMHLSVSSQRGRRAGIWHFPKNCCKIPTPEQKCEVKYNWNFPPREMICGKMFAKYCILTCDHYFTIKNGSDHGALFWVSNSKTKGVKGCIVAIVSCLVKKMTKSCSASIGHSFDTNVVGKWQQW